MNEYQIASHAKSKSEVVAQGLKLLEKVYLEACYKEESLNNEDIKHWDVTAGDGLDDETW